MSFHHSVVNGFNSDISLYWVCANAVSVLHGTFLMIRSKMKIITLIFTRNLIYYSHVNIQEVASFHWPN